MAENTSVEWCDKTNNDWIGCTPISPGCLHCFAAVSTPARVLHISWGSNEPRHRTTEANRKKPFQWNKKHEEFFKQHGRRCRVFCSSLSDVFDNEVPDQWRDDLFHTMQETPNLDWLVLTKRVGNVKKMAPAPWLAPGGWPTHIRIGITVVNQQEADRDIPKLLALPCPNFLSVEPLLDALSLQNHLLGIHHVIVGGESGPGARPMHPQWARDLRDECREAGTPFFMKQMGGVRDKRGSLTDLPEDLRIRQFPVE